MRNSRSLTERLAMELRWMEHRDAALSCGNTSSLTSRQVWDRISEVLKDSYRADAKHLLKFLYGKTGDGEDEGKEVQLDG